MKGSRRRLLGWITGLVMTTGFVAAGCGGGNSEAKNAAVKAGNMPDGGDWTGVYYSQTFGFLHLVKSGNSASGKWRTAAGDKWGELHGTVTGDLLKYEWVEHTIGLVGPGADAKGKGYFRYIVPAADNADHELKGEWGLNRDEAGNPWDAIKQRNQIPDPDSVKPDETQRLKGPADDWQ